MALAATGGVGGIGWGGVALAAMGGVGGTGSGGVALADDAAIPSNVTNSSTTVFFNMDISLWF